MTIEGALLARLGAVTGLTDLVGTRIYALQAPQGTTLPNLTFQRLSSARVHLFNADPTLRESVWQFDAWGKSYDEACDVAEQIEAALSRYEGTLDGTVIQLILVENDTDTHELDSLPDALDLGVYRRMVEARVFYEA